MDKELLNSTIFSTGSNKLYFIWLGGVYTENIVLSRPAVSTAGNRWQLGLLHGLRSRSVDVFVVGHIYEPMWPNGKLFVDDKQNWKGMEIEGLLIRYVNLPGWRQLSQFRRTICAIENIIETKGFPAAIISYNAYPLHASIGLYMQKKFGIPWVPIIADVPEQGMKRNRHDREVEQAAGRVYLPWGSYDKSRHFPKFHLDGGVHKIRFDKEDCAMSDSGKKKTILYAGRISLDNGIMLLVESFLLLKDTNLELCICGKGMLDELDNAMKQDSRIKYMGVVPEVKLEQLSKEATIFINSYLPSNPINQGKFPSKILEYLSYGKPVISTWTDGISPEYRNILEVVEVETPQCFAEKISEVISWRFREKQAFKCRAKEFLGENKLWDVQADKLIKWLFENILD